MCLIYLQRSDFGTDGIYATNLAGKVDDDIKHENAVLCSSLLNNEQNHNISDNINNIQELKHPIETLNTEGDFNKGSIPINIKEELDTFVYNDNPPDKKVIKTMPDNKNILEELESKDKSVSMDAQEKCRFCDEIFNQRKQRLKHEKDVHSKSTAKQKCPFCTQTFQTKSLLRKHHLEDHPDQESSLKKPAPNYVECTICGKNVKEKALLLHMNRHADPEYKKGANGRELCSTCGKSISSRSMAKHLERHQKRLHREKKTKWQDVKVLCPICGNYYKRGYMATHMKYHAQATPGEARYACLQCPKRYRSQSNLIVHVKTIHTGEYKKRDKVTCEICNITLTEGGMYTHKKTKHADGRIFPCKQCGTIFHKYPDLIAHRNKVHKVCYV